ncbi:hypothetical protein [Phenylobacterium sp.]|jgi:uncharacterized membrane protein YjjB (DUF3815 family)|uniref:hypothetical protein n=1 Tax=Phenylobacterium sp. TaxID=1871053 RepID=UPI002F42F1A6
MKDLAKQLSARWTFRVVLAVSLLMMLGRNLPGHLSYDSVAQLYEGRFHVRETWGPPLYAAILGFFDRFVPGTALYVTASAALFWTCLASMPDLRPRTSWLVVAVTAPLMLIPQVFIYQAIVWKDVAFANCAVAGLVCIAHAARVWPHRVRRWLLLIAAALFLAIGSQVRQNGIIAAGFAALALGWVAGQGRWLRSAAWALGGLLAVAVLGQTLTFFSIPPMSPPQHGVSVGLRIVQNYDLMGAAALDPSYRLDAIVATSPAEAALMRQRARLDYSGRRVDFIDRDEVMTDALWRIPDSAANKQWADLIVKHPGLYLRLRWEDFRWVFAPPVIDWCLPIYVGVDAPTEKMAPLKLEHRFEDSDARLNNYATWFLGTPIYEHGFYAAISLVVAALLFWRRQPQDVAIAALQLAGVAFAASFFIISIACDYRYLYFTDLAAIAGLIYVAVDPPSPWLKSA